MQRKDDPSYWMTFEGRTCIAKKHLIDGAYYTGHCRNADIARWDAKENKFYYWREKFGERFIEDIRHPQDDDGFDLFFPARLVVLPIITTTWVS